VEIHIFCIDLRDESDIDLEFPLSPSAVVSGEFMSELEAAGKTAA
jgi:hypothetical protein